MDSRKIVLLAGALVVAAITAFFARSIIAGSAAPQASAVPIVAPAQIDGPKVLIATRALPVGTIIDPGAIKFQPWPKALVENAYFQEGDGFDMKNVVGTVVRNAITAGQPVTQGALVKPGDRGFLAAALGPGMRAVTFPVSTQSSVAGFVFPGDRVDLLLTQTVPGGGDGAPLKASETVVRNLRVLATDQRTSNDKDEAGNTIVRTFSTVTIEATPRIAEQIAVAQTLGSLSLSLRSIADNQAQYEAITAGAKGGETVQIAATPQSGKASVSVGGDVSRFQRRTVPGTPGAATAAIMPTVRVARGTDVNEITFGVQKPASAVAVADVSAGGKN